MLEYMRNKYLGIDYHLALTDQIHEVDWKEKSRVTHF